MKARRRVYLDANVLICAAMGDAGMEAAIRGLTKARVRFVTSDILELEVLPTRKRDGERGKAALRWLECFFAGSDRRRTNSKVIRTAFAACEAKPLGVADAMHLAHAHVADVDVLYTLEDDAKPMFHTGLVVVKAMPTHGPWE